MQRGIKRALVHLQNLLGDLPDALRDAPAVHGLERKSSQDQQVQRALNQVRRLGHLWALLSINDGETV
jgi:hypothetical protein